MEPTEWAYCMGKFITHTVYTLFALLHIGNMIFGSILLFPMFSDLHLLNLDEPYQVQLRKSQKQFLFLLLWTNNILYGVMIFFDFS